MKLSKKFMSLFVALVLSIGFLVACGDDDNNNDDTDESGTEQDELEVDNDEPDWLSAASESSNPEDLIGVMTYGANWMFAAKSDMVLEDDLVIAGELHNRNDEIARKLALYAQVREENEETGEVESTVTDEFTLTVPNIIVRSENTLLQHGTVNGNVTVEAEGFGINGTNITGDLVFATQVLYDSAEISDEDLIAGEIVIID